MARAEAPPPPREKPPTDAQSNTSLRAVLNAGLIERAVRETLADQPAQRTTASGTVFGADPGADPYRQFRQHVDEAKVPYCLHHDGLKRQPTFFLSGYLALPFIAVAGVRGKCLF
ncbi:hypothetical protein B0920_00275 [Massilia sp. KIM]|nr:hypothetical protein B0920_00275 [Massilia sp. KIM]